MTPTWFEHATFWSGVRRATIAPRSHMWYLFVKFVVWTLTCSYLHGILSHALENTANKRPGLPLYILRYERVICNG